MKIIIIVAMDKNGLIGKGSGLPWHFSEDLKYFKETTMGKFVIMGKNTYLSIGKPLEGRNLVVLSGDEDFKAQYAEVAHSIDEALDMVSGEVFIAGGRSVYKQFLKIADEMYVTIIDDTFEGDLYFPDFNEGNWEIIEETKGKNSLLTFKKLKRKYEKSN